MQLSTRVKIDFMGIFVFKIVPLIYSLLFASYFIQQPYVQIPFPIAVLGITMPFAIVTGLYIVEAYYLYKESPRGIRAFTFETVVGMIGAFAGILLIGYVFLFKYEFTDPSTNTIYGWFILIGTIMIFIHARKEIFEHKLLTKNV